MPFILQILIHFLLSLLPLWNLCLQLQKGISLLLWQCLSSYQWSFFYSILNKRNLWLQYCWFFKFVCFFNTSFFFLLGLEFTNNISRFLTVSVSLILYKIYLFYICLYALFSVFLPSFLTCFLSQRFLYTQFNSSWLT